MIIRNRLSRCVMLAIALSLALASQGAAITFDFPLTTDQEIPPPTLNGLTPTGSAQVSVNTLTGDVSVDGTWTGMTSDVTAAHIHGLAPAGETAGVLLGLDLGDGTLTGSGTLDDAGLAGLLDGLAYINVHTMDNGPGEIRGQIVDSDIHVFDIMLDTASEVPAPTLGDASPFGDAQIVVDSSSGEVEISGNYAGLTSDATAAHLHGLAGPGSTAGVIFGFDVTGGTSGSFSGSATLSSDELSGLLSGQTYINLHTANNGPGELRGQVPEPTAATLLVVGLLAASLGRRRGQGRRVS